MLWMLPALGAIGGALLKKDDPLKGALLGGGIGALGGMAAPGLLAGGAGTAAAGAAGGETAAGMLAAQEAGLGATSLGWGGATTGMQGALNGALGAEAGAATGGLLGTAGKAAGPVMAGMDAAQAMNPPQQPIQAQPLQTQPADFSGLLAQGEQARQMDAEKSRQMKELMAQYAQFAGGM